MQFSLAEQIIGITKTIKVKYQQNSWMDVCRITLKVNITFQLIDAKSYSN